MTKIVNIKGVAWEITKPEDVYAEFQRTLQTGHRLNIDVANIIANVA